ncbi:hypothetical protein D3273_13465 [Lichenibacterium minor]|uniref:Uncharacterized protein n=1 Tax=Lichenibacterium minor TaxID=2316528 RepID=A0A4Q2U4S4_9HYPH|nr:hypothetical protein [Lichenibacterium minor]RYC31392.1 hypothetical protein D3273_13465 [Lichenibacterium minor]
MIDPVALLDDVFSGLDGSATRPIPGSEGSVPGAVPGSFDVHPIEMAYSSRTSRCSRSENGVLGKSDREPARNDVAPLGKVARTRSHVVAPGTPGTPGIGGKSLAVSTFPQFPVKDVEPGTPGTESGLCERIGPPPGDPLPISPADVRAGVERELRALAEDGREGPAALRDAVEITRAKVRNSEALAERQAHGGRCHVCDGPLDDSAPVVAVLSGRRGAPLFMHAACCPAYTTRRTVLVDKIIVAAGYGAEAEGEAA